MKKSKKSQIQYGRSYRYGSSEAAIKDLTRLEKKQKEAKRMETATEIFLDPNAKPDGLLWPPRVEAESGWIKHVYCEGARFHVLHWSGGAKGSRRHCSEPDCIINKPLSEDNTNV